MDEYEQDIDTEYPTFNALNRAVNGIGNVQFCFGIAHRHYSALPAWKGIVYFSIGHSAFFRAQNHLCQR